ncbi:hypothetical protein P8452_14276 [Trifolium repens]|nr:hypothetical protein P8452_14276 [Trifolium repens]
MWVGRDESKRQGLNLSGSWQQGHSATYNTPSRVPQGSSALRGPPTARASGGPRPPTAGRQANDGRTHRF